MEIKNKKIFKTISGIAIAATIFASQVITPLYSVTDKAMTSEITVNAAAKTVEDCDYTFDVNSVIGGTVVNEDDEKEQYILDLSSLPDDAVIEQVMVQVSTGTKEETAMIAIGCYAEGYNEDNWFSASGTDAGTEITYTYDIPEEVSSLFKKDFTSINIQHWWGSIDTVTVEKVGVNVAGGAATAIKVDFNWDKKITSADFVLFTQYMQGLLTDEKYDLAADYDSSGKVNVLDYILVKNQLIKKLIDSSISDNEKSAIDFVQNITIGWNLGNTLDSTCSWITNPTPAQFETAWGNPVTTKEMIDAVKREGFNTVRIPVSWGEKMGAGPDYKVSEEWMTRVNEVVDYVIDNDMYCILNVHHDNDWLVPTYEKYDGAEAQLTKLWEQISERFENYDEHLIFETMNEPRLVGTTLEWTGGNAEARDCINKFNAAALETIRKSGGNNALRYVMMPTYAASGTTVTINDYKIPDDPRAIVSIHSYSPYSFALDAKGTSSWGTTADKVSLKQEMKLLYDKFISNGTAVIIGEFGAMNKDNEADRNAWAEYYIATAKELKIRCIWWDNNLVKGEGEKFGLIDRKTSTAPYPAIIEALFKGLNG